jgi:hypothetical protein
MVFEPAGTLSIVAGEILPVLVPFRYIAAPEGTELTEIFPTAETVTGNNRRTKIR